MNSEQQAEQGSGPDVRMLLDVEDVAKLMGVKESWIRDRCRPSTPDEDRIPGQFKIGRYVKFQAAVVREWIAGGCKSPVAKAGAGVKSRSKSA